MAIHTPDGVKPAVFAPLLPDRFARRPRRTPPRGLQWRPWGSPPAQQGFQGGDRRGLVDQLDDLQDLGVIAFYLTPIGASASHHRYHPYDAAQGDPRLGGTAALRELLDAAHNRGQTRAVTLDVDLSGLVPEGTRVDDSWNRGR